jgi:hypothetical protein
MHKRKSTNIINMSSEPSPFQQHLNNNLGTLSHLGALSEYERSRTANAHNRKLVEQNEQLLKEQNKLVKNDKDRLKLEERRVALEEERNQLLKDRQRDQDHKVEAIKSARKTLTNAKFAIERLESEFGMPE